MVRGMGHALIKSFLTCTECPILSHNWCSPKYAESKIEAAYGPEQPQAEGQG